MSQISRFGFFWFVCISFVSSFGCSTSKSISEIDVSVVAEVTMSYTALSCTPSQSQVFNICIICAPSQDFPKPPRTPHSTLYTCLGPTGNWKGLSGVRTHACHALAGKLGQICGTWRAIQEDDTPEVRASIPTAGPRARGGEPYTVTRCML